MQRFKRQPRQRQLGILIGLAIPGWVAWLAGDGWLAAAGMGLGIGSLLALFSRGLPFRLWLRTFRVHGRNGRAGLSLLKEMLTIGLMALQILVAVRLRPEVDLSAGQLLLAVGLMVFFNTEIGESLTERAMPRDPADREKA